MYSRSEPEDLIKFGLIPELVGRARVASLAELTEEAPGADSDRAEECLLLVHQAAGPGRRRNGSSSYAL